MSNNVPSRQSGTDETGGLEAAGKRGGGPLA